MWNTPAPGFYKQTSAYFDPNYTTRQQTVGEVAMDVLGAAGGIKAVGLAAKGVSVLPEALATGRNAVQGVDVYLGVRGGEAVYCGISYNVTQRAAQHGSRFEALDVITPQSVTLGQARAIEQAIIVRNPGFENIRNSINPSQPYYQEAVIGGMHG